MENNKKINHSKKKSEHYGFIGSNNTNKYSNPYQNNIYDELINKKDSKKTVKKEKKKERGSIEKRDSTDTGAGVDVTQVPSIPLVYYQQPVASVPIQYYPNYTSTPVAIQYVTPSSPLPEINSSNDSDSSEKELNNEDKEGKLKDDGRRNTNQSFYSENRINEKEKELEEIMSELGMKRKDNEKKTFKEKLIANQLFLIITGLLLFIFIVILYFFWPRMPTIFITSIQPYGDNPIQYRFPFNVQNRDSYVNLSQLNETEIPDLSAYVLFDMEIKFEVENSNYIGYKLSSIFIEYLLSTELLPANVLIADNFIQDLSFKPRKTSVMSTYTTFGYTTRNIKSDIVFEYLLNKCGISEKSSKINIDYKITMKMPVISIIHSPTYTKNIPFDCPFTKDSKYTVTVKEKVEPPATKKDNDENTKNNTTTTTTVASNNNTDNAKETGA